ncbi:MAG: ATP-dependent Clp protease ATP-binding subunit [bacterium]|nr:ATP-dependent Clp protease ATP-binding subunit [bacterium]
MRVLKRLLHFPIFWYQNAPTFLFSLFRKITLYIDQNLAVTLMAKMMLVPVFNDYSAIGRLISLGFRVVRVGTGMALIAVANLSLLSFLVAWLLFPVWLLLHWQFLGLLTLAILALGYAFLSYGDPLKTLAEIKGSQEIEAVLTASAFELISNLGENEQKEFLFKLLREERIIVLLMRLGLLPEEVVAKVAMMASTLPYPREALVEAAYREACRFQADHLGPEHFLMALYDNLPELKELFHQLHVESDDWESVLKWQAEREKILGQKFLWDPTYSFGPMGGINRGWTGRITPNLDQYSRDLTLEAQRGHLLPLVGREEEIAEAVRILGRSLKNNVMLIGPAGCGKTTLVGGIAQEIIKGTHSSSIRFKRVVSLDVPALVAGAETPGALNARIVAILREIASSRNIILFVDEIQALSTAVGNDPAASPLLNAFVPHLSAGEFQFIGATSQESYKKYIEPNASFARVFQIITLQETTEPETIEILKRLAWELEGRNKIIVALPAITAAVHYSSRLIPDRVLPDKAIDVLDEAVVKAKDEKKLMVGEQDVIEIVSRKTNVPVASVSPVEAGELLNLEERMHTRLVDQEEAVTAIADALRRARVGLREETRPIATFLFVGPTGVGKTEAAKTLAEIYFGSEKRIMRLDMSEFQQRESLSRLVGAAPGQKDAEAGGQLTEAVRHEPFSLVLIDEVEKAHPEIILLFLQVLEDGRLSDGQGHSVDFTHTIIIFTSNVGTEMIQKGIENQMAVGDLEKEVWEKLEEKFRPEFLNRFSKVVIFKPLTLEQVEQIAQLQLTKIASRLANRGINLEFSAGLVKLLAEKGFSSTWGARPLRRLIEEEIEAPLAKMILSQKLKEGDNFRLEESFLNYAK